MKKLFTILSAAAVMAIPAIAFADDAPQRSGMFGGGNYSMFIMLGLALVFFYFIILRPERKRRKAMEDKRSSMKKGDRITTTTGIRATVHKIENETVIVKLYDGAKMEILKAAVMDIQPGTGQEMMDEKTVQVVDARS